MKTDGQVLIELSRGVHPQRPQDSIVTEARWELLCACWQREPSHRPALEAVIGFLEDPHSAFRLFPRPLPHLTNIHVHKLFNSSHGRKMELWTATSNGGKAVSGRSECLP